MYCPSCGAQNVEGVKFCKTCGKALETASAPVATAAQPVTPAPAPQQQVTNVAQTAPASENSSTAAFVLAIIAVVLTFIPIPFIDWIAGPCAIIGFALAFNIWYLAKKNDSTVPVKMIIALVFAAYALLNILTTNMGGGAGLDALASGLGSFLGSMY